jgi:hypothetical protein
MRQNLPHFGFDGRGPARPGTPRPVHEACSALSPELTAAAEAIAGGTPSEWLIRKLVVLASMVTRARTNERDQLTRVEIMRRLDAIDPNILLPLAQLIDPRTSELLLHLDGAEESSIDIDTLNAFRHHLLGLRDVLPELALRAKKARKKLEGGGRGRAWALPDALSSEELCATIVSETWLRVRSDPLPPTTNPQLHQAGDALWTATGGDAAIPWSGNKIGERTADGHYTNSKWRNHFARAREASDGRDLIIYILEDCRTFQRHVARSPTGPIPSLIV